MNGPSGEPDSGWSPGCSACAEMSGVMSRATSSEMNTAAAIVRPNSLKYWPVMPPMKLTGSNTAMIVIEVATTARPISSAASSDAW